jgi:hypothetical protein
VLGLVLGLVLLLCCGARMACSCCLAGPIQQGIQFNCAAVRFCVIACCRCCGSVTAGAPTASATHLLLSCRAQASHDDSEQGHILILVRFLLFFGLPHGSLAAQTGPEETSCVGKQCLVVLLCTATHCHCDRS